MKFRCPAYARRRIYSARVAYRAWEGVFEIYKSNYVVKTTEFGGETAEVLPVRHSGEAVGNCTAIAVMFRPTDVRVQRR